MLILRSWWNRRIAALPPRRQKLSSQPPTLAARFRSTHTAAVTDPLRPSAQEALEAWAQRVRANRDQAERVREAPERPDFYAPVASAFRADPRRTDEPALDILRGLVHREDTWLDIGAGGGRYALPVALLARPATIPVLRSAACMVCSSLTVASFCFLN